MRRPGGSLRPHIYCVQLVSMTTGLGRLGVGTRRSWWMKAVFSGVQVELLSPGGAGGARGVRVTCSVSPRLRRNLLKVAHREHRWSHTGETARPQLDASVCPPVTTTRLNVKQTPPPPRDGVSNQHSQVEHELAGRKQPPDC